MSSIDSHECVINKPASSTCMANLDDDIGPASSTTKHNDDIGPVSSRTKHNDDIGPVSSRTKHNDDIGPVSSRTKHDDDIGPASSMTKHDDDFGPASSTTNHDDNIGPVSSMANHNNDDIDHPTSSTNNHQDCIDNFALASMTSHQGSIDDPTSHDTEILLPCKPEKPLDSDCCGSGCIPCVFDIYDQEIAIWEKECRRLKQRVTQESNCQDDDGPVLREDTYRQFTISDVTKESHDTYRFRLVLPDSKSLGLQLGQHVVIRCRNEGVVLTRQYTPVSDITCEGYFDLIIKLYDTGQMSQHIRSWKIGTPVEVRGPFGSFQYKANKYKRLLMIAAGTGIAPMAQIIQGILNNECDETFVRLLYACKTYKDILLKEELDEWANYWNFSVVYVLSQEPENVKYTYKYGDDVIRGRINSELLSTDLEKLGSVDCTQIAVCGTRSFDTDILKYFEVLQIPSKNVFKF